MPGPAHEMEVRLTLAQLRRAKYRGTSVETDEAMLEQLRKVLPAGMAGHSQWTGVIDDGTPVWVRWHWYFDEIRRDFVVGPHGFSTNITLTCPGSDAPLSTAILFRAVLRRIRRNEDWQPQVRTPARQAAATPRIDVDPLRSAAKAPAPAIAARPAPSDGNADWAQKVVRDLELLPLCDQFGQIAKLARQKFGFDQTVAIARARDQPLEFVIDTNHPPAWSEVYASEQFALTDPRLHWTGPPKAWSAVAQQVTDPGFWNVAMRHGALSGWVMASPDGSAALVLSRNGSISAAELEVIEPNLVVLAEFAHRVMHTRLQARSTRLGNEGLLLSPQHYDVLRHLATGKHRKAIVDLLGMSLSTVDRRIADIKTVLNVRTRAEALHLAQRLGILQP